MRNRILEIVVFLIDYMRDYQGHQADVDDLSGALKSLGYSDPEITAAYSWFLERFNGTAQRFYSDFPRKHCSGRVLTDAERSRITPEAYGFLIELSNKSLISDEQLESIIERATFFASDPITLEQIKIIASAVMFHEDGDPDSPAMLNPVNDQSVLLN